MTNEEAIERLKNIWVTFFEMWGVGTREDHIAFDMAIEALEEQQK